MNTTMLISEDASRDSCATPSTGAFTYREQRAWLCRELVLMLFGVALLISSGMKSYALLAAGRHIQPTALAEASVLFDTTGWRLSVVVVEWLLGTWLIGGWFRAQVQYTAIGVLAVFAALVGWRWWSGQDDCGCFDLVKVRPVWTLSLDLLGLMSLVLLQWKRTFLFRRAVWTGGGILAAGSIGTLAVVFTLSLWPSVGKVIDHGMSPVMITPAVFRTEHAQLNDTVRAVFDVENISDSPVQIVGVQSSCGCYSPINGFPILIPSHRKQQLTMMMKIGTPDASGRYIRTAKLILDSGVVDIPMVAEATVK